MLTQGSLPLIATLSGVSLHTFIYRFGEWDTTSVLLVQIYTFIFVGGNLALYLDLLTSTGLGLSPVAFSSLCGYHVLGVYTSMLVYRLLFHRLRRFPGPFFGRLTNFYATTLSMNLQKPREVQKVHREYGDYVRLGPCELSIADPQAVKVIYGTQSSVTKGPWYTLLEPRVPLFMARDKQEHARRRKVWDQGFSTKALHDYEPRVSKYTDQLLQVIHKNAGKPINITPWFTYFSFDVMVDLSFGKTSNMLVDGTESYILRTIRTDMAKVAYFSHLPWLFPFTKRVPFLNSNYLRFWEWIANQISERAECEHERPDVFSWILNEYRQGLQLHQDTLNLHGDAHLIVVAGSDTVATSLTNVFCHLACNPAIVKELQSRLDALPDLESHWLAQIDLFDAILNETWRLQSPNPSGLQRVTPAEGLKIGDKFIPGNVVVQVPTYTVYRDSRAFERPDEFIPERWTSRPELVKDRSAFIPFGSGPYACVGKRLASMELRRVIAVILHSYDVTLAPGQSAKAFWEGQLDTFTLVAPSLELVFTRREQV
ncbi:putative cytochrome P450 oxidoreductase [Aspergillus bombycis]|uniref:Putative cytochrome P450 oxidoreductase n=1 Tax=Aspergillus bombycis TaxID=109264 RepID=A0A1F8A963_9EURO|nr:putative cytochrome P450 oxidoreductase [Aspergillus bombycis]OGM48310.1 putative cytochrome P450 oxidoreductase [Aspergillus bombycis]